MVNLSTVAVVVVGALFHYDLLHVQDETEMKVKMRRELADYQIAL